MSCEKITCLAIGDPHFQVNNVPDAQELIEKVNNLVEEQQPTFVVILGDLLHTHEKIHTTPFNLATKFITSLARKVHVFLIIGNHDYCFGENVQVMKFDGTPILSQNIKMGDILMGDDFLPRTVISTTNGCKQLYTISTFDSELHPFQVTCDHLLSLIKFDENNYKYIDISAEEFYNLNQNEKIKYKLYTATKIRKTIAYLTYDINVVPSEIGNYYGWTVDGNNKFLLFDNTVVHNCNNQQFLTNRHPFNSFKRIANVTVCDRVIARNICGLKFVFCPYVPPDRFEEALDTLKEKNKTWNDATCIFAHQEFYGCSFNPVSASVNGDIWPEVYPLVVSGHIHNEQRLQKNIYYTGSSMQHAFGETANKTIALLTFEQNREFKLQKIDLEMKKKKIVYLDLLQVSKFKPETGVHIKLTLRGKPEDFKVFRKSKLYKDLQKQCAAISFTPVKEIQEAHQPQNPKKTNVLDILQDLIKNENKYVKQSFQKIIE